MHISACRWPALLFSTHWWPVRCWGRRTESRLLLVITSNRFHDGIYSIWPICYSYLTVYTVSILFLYCVFLCVFSGGRSQKQYSAWFWSSLCAGYHSTSAVSWSSPSMMRKIRTAVNFSGREEKHIPQCFSCSTIKTEDRVYKII